MLWVEIETPVTAPVSLWFPGRKQPEGGFPPPLPPLVTSSAARTEEIARSREELLGLLRGVPESDYELSLTDLVEKGPAILAGGDQTSAEGEGVPKERRWRSSSAGAGGVGRRRSSDGVLLNMYVPSSLTRSLTGSRSKRCPSKRVAETDCNKRDREPSSFGCWSAIWEKGREKTRRQ